MLARGPRPRLYTAVGETIHTVTRLLSLAAPGTVVLSEATYRLVHNEIWAVPCGSLAGVTTVAPMTVYTVEGIRRYRAGVPAPHTRDLSRFVGRERELAILHDRLAYAAQGQGQVVGLVGEPGMGKSRLLYEFVQSLRGQTVATEQGFPQQLAQAIALQGWVLAACGQGEEGITQIHQGLDAYQATGVMRDRPYYLALLAEASLQAGRTAAGLEALAEALATLTTSGGYWWAAELHRLQGELLLAQEGLRQQEVEAEVSFCQALAVARRQQAKSLELRATLSLSRLWQRQGKSQEAYDLLAPVYGWFTEGVDTADLQEAKAVLEALAG